MISETTESFELKNFGLGSNFTSGVIQGQISKFIESGYIVYKNDAQFFGPVYLFLTIIFSCEAKKIFETSFDGFC